MTSSSSTSNSDHENSDQEHTDRGSTVVTECERWGELTDRVALGEKLVDDEWRFVSAHEQKCSACDAEAGIYAHLRSLLHGQAEQTEPAEQPSTPHLLSPPGLLRRRRSIVFGGGAVAIAAATALLFWGGTQQGRPLSATNRPSSSVSSVDRPTAVALAAGDVRIGDSPIAAGSTLHLGDRLRVAAGRVCVDQQQGTTSCLSENSSLLIEESSTTVQRVHLEKGRVVCQLEEKREGEFVVSTGLVTVTATGTVFAVETNESSVSVRLHRGSVIVRASSGESRKMIAPSALTFDGAWKDLAWDDAAAASDSELVEPARLWAKKPVGALTVDGIGEEGTIALDKIELGPPPVSILTSPGAHSLLVESPERLPYQHEVRVAEKGTVIRPSLDLAERRGLDSSPTPSSTGASAALARAQTLRSAGKLVDAADAYRRLIAQHASAPEARAALLSLGHLELKSLGHPTAALAHFERYLEVGGQLSQEASFGRIQALQRLGHREEAEKAIAQFLRAYPGSAQAESLRQARKQAP